MLARHTKQRPRSRATFASVFGELLLTAGVIIGGFVGWQYYLSDNLMGAEQQREAASFAQTITTNDGVYDGELRTDAPPVEDPVAMYEDYAVLHIPRLNNLERVIGEGAVPAVIDKGLGRYETTSMPGEKGNMAIAGHRNGLGGPFTELDRLVVGDRFYVQTSEAWYVYEYRNAAYIPPTQVSVIAPVPDLPGVEADDSYISLTTCHPRWSADARLVAYGVFIGWVPEEEGMPKELADFREGLD